jgi:hypothetical protein
MRRFAADQSTIVAAPGLPAVKAGFQGLARPGRSVNGTIAGKPDLSKMGR